jgi:hypothetical protein
MANKNIRSLSTCAIASLAVFLIYYPYRFLTDIIPFAFTNPEMWQTHWMVEHDVVIPNSIRFAYFGLWIMPVIATVLMTAVSMHFFYLIRRGVYFDHRIVRDIQLLGTFAAIAGAGVTLGYSLSPWLLTIMNSEERRDIHFGYEPSEISLILTGVGLFIAGWIWKVVVLKDQENKEFV